MRVAVVGATGRVGRPTVGALERMGHETVAISRTQGIDVYTGDGLVTALTGVDAVVDASSSAATNHDEAVAFFSRSTRNLLEAERQTGVQHHVLLSIDVDRARRQRDDRSSARTAGRARRRRRRPGGGRRRTAARPLPGPFPRRSTTGSPARPSPQAPRPVTHGRDGQARRAGLAASSEQVPSGRVKGAS